MMRFGPQENTQGRAMRIISPRVAVTASDLGRAAADWASAGVGLRVGLHVADVAQTVQALMALEQRAALVCLVPTSLSGTMLKGVVASCALDAVLSDVPGAVEALAGVVPVVGALSELPANPSAIAPSDATRWVLLTSGTSGMPKAVSHTLQSLTRASRVHQTHNGRVVWGLLYEHMRFAGLQVVLQAVLSGADLLVPDADAPLEQRLEFLLAHGCTHLSATPTLWRLTMMSTAGRQLALQQITLGGEIADERVLAALRSAYPAARISHIYASTEAGVGFSVSDGRPGFPLAYLSEPPKGIRLRVLDSRLHVMNPLVGGGYLNTAQVFRDAQGWVDTGDVVEVAGDRVVFKGRASGMVNVGGDKVLPEEVEQVLLSHPLVAAARVYAASNPIVGALISADIVVRPSLEPATDLRSQLRQYCAARLARYKVPASYRIVPHLDVGASGKLQRVTAA